MLNFLYSEYPFGAAEPFAEYELRAFEEAGEKNIQIYSLCEKKNTDIRFVPEGCEVRRVFRKKTMAIHLHALLGLLSKDVLGEILLVLRNRPKEGMLRAVHRIYRYVYMAAAFRQEVSGQTGPTDTFVSYWLNECAYAALAVKKKIPSVTVVSRGHGFDLFEERCYMPFRKKILSQLDQIFVIHQVGYEYLERRYPWLDMRKVQVSRLGVTIPQSASAAPEGEPFHVVTCSSIIPLKRLDLMIEALANVDAKEILWTHIGSGPLEQEIKEKAMAVLSGKDVKVDFKGHMSLADVHRFYETTPVHLFVNCSDTEGIPVSIMEAMSYGIPCVARDVGGNREIVDGTCGELLPTQEDPAALSGAIRRVMDMPQEAYQRLREKARERIQERFNYTENFKEYARQISELSR